MAMQRFDVSCDPSVYEAWPDLVATQSERLLCFFCECTHHGDRSYSRIVYVASDDHGRTWSDKIALSEPIHSDGSTFWNCPRATRLRDGRIAVICDRTSRRDETQAEVHLWMGDPEGMHFDGPVNLHLQGIVPDKLLELQSGRWIVACHLGNVDGFANLQQRLYYSDDAGAHWHGPVTVARDARYNLCEASILEVEPDLLVCFMRENSSMGYECMACMSHDGGLTWGELYTVPLAGCHRPVAGFLDTGEILITYRYRQGAQRGWLGHWTQNTFLAVTDRETVCSASRDRQQVRIMPLHYDPSSEADLGYTGWVQFRDGEIYIVDYIRGDQPKCHIIATALRREDIGGL